LVNLWKGIKTDIYNYRYIVVKGGEDSYNDRY